MLSRGSSKGGGAVSGGVAALADGGCRRPRALVRGGLSVKGRVCSRGCRAGWGSARGRVGGKTQSNA
eukprot:5250628-Prymnesium_polylepis.1